MLSSSSSSKQFNLDLQPTQAWVAILGFIVLSALLTLTGAGSIVRLAFPVGSLAVGIFLYRQYPILYLGFTWWLWFLTPLVRRLVDYRSGFDPTGLMVVSPFLVTLVTLATFLQHLPKTYRQHGLPFVLSFVGVFYGFLVGLIKTSPFIAAKALLEWLTPVIFGFYLFANWRDYPSYRQNIQRTFVWGALVTGIYGVIQYLVAPEWDRLWLIGIELTSMGKPEPLGIRVWSTMNAPGPFAVVMMAALLLLFTSKGALRLPASAAGYLAFLLSAVRSAWLGWFVGLLTLVTAVKANLQMRLIITIVVMAVCVFPLTTVEPFSEIITSRLETFSNLENDSSAQARTQIYNEQLGRALTNFQGEGIGGVPSYDSAILDMLLSLGWFGTIFYLGGMLLLVFELFQASESRFDPFAGASRAIVLGVFIQLIFGSVMLGINGVVLWGFLGMGMAARKYYWYQRTIGLK